MTQLNTRSLAKRSNSAPSERRASVRFPCECDTLCHPITSAGGQQWSGQVHDISEGGVGLVLTRRFELGTLLAIDIQNPDGSPFRTLWGRVVHVHQQTDGTWQMGCAFAAPLTEEELATLV